MLEKNDPKETMKATEQCRNKLPELFPIFCLWSYTFKTSFEQVCASFLHKTFEEIKAKLSPKEIKHIYEYAKINKTKENSKKRITDMQLP